MAIKATIFKANLQIADMERHYYADHALTIARHPSENDERMMVRLLAFALHAHEYLEFGQGMTDESEADLWQKDLTGAIELWVDVGIPDEKLIRKACGRADRVVVYCYGGRVAEMWYAQNSGQFERQKNLSIINLPTESTRAIAALTQRTMQMQCTIQDGQVWLSDGKESVMVEREVLKQAASWPSLR
ncbi:MAG: YaeQ family protein [Nitrosomonadales bacterium]|nr:YaeQ family protein [Nitrosomonadales bacterium]